MAGKTNNNTDSPPPATSNPPTLSIWQQNVNKSSSCQHDLISSARLARQGIDLVALQEPSINNFGTTVASREWIPIYPSTHSNVPHKTRSIFLLRSNILTDQWRQIDFPSSDVTVVQFSGEWGQALIFNIYNDCNSNDTVHQLEEFSLSCRRPTDAGSTGPDITIWLGDFNRHHPHWDDPNDTRLFTRSALDDAELLINAVAESGLEMVLPQGIPTHQHNVTKRWSRLDHVFISEEALDLIISCETLTVTPGINTDHLPILTTLDLELARAPTSTPKNFRDVDWDEFQKKLSSNLEILPPPSRINTQSELNTACSKLTEIIQDTINSEVPTSRIGIKSKKVVDQRARHIKKERQQDR